jgi:nicotinamide-nucleotide amidase
LNDNPDFIFITGGLGPTHDDITRNSIKSFFNLEEEFDQKYFDELKFKFDERGIDMPESNRSQAMSYKNCTMLNNPKGTAKGIRIDFNYSKIFVLPGVPIEMKAIFNDSINSILPIVSNNSIITLKAFGISESSLAQKMSKILDKWKSKVEIAFLPSHLGVDVRINNLKNPNINLSEIMESIYLVIGRYFFGRDNEKLEQVIVDGLKLNNLTLSVAESCTGGKLANFITSIPNSSTVFIGGIVAYSNLVKMNLLNVDKNMIEEKGAVSEEVAIQMAIGIREKTNSDIGIGITGISGPTGGTDEKPLGLVYIAISGAENYKVKKFILKMDRNMHQETTSYIALNMIRRYYFRK